MKIVKSSVLVVLLILTSVLTLHSVRGTQSYETLIRNGSAVEHYNSSEDIMIPTVYEERDTEFRGVWVATVYNLNISKHTSETQYKAAIDNLVAELVESNANAMLFQVRPTNDAFYDSAYAPFSRYLDGVEGSNPGWDVLQYLIDTCHANGIEFHAWMNPYRVANTTSDKTTYLNTLHNENFAKQNPSLVISGNPSSGRNPLILNPGEPAVKEYIVNVVDEIMDLYDIDGIHFDDYFYPYSGLSSDTATYNAYKEDGQSISDWRRENVNDVVEGVKNAVDAHNLENNKDIRFGISPFGLWGSEYDSSTPGGSNTGSSNLSSYKTQFADSKRWVEEGWLHYICPQVYWSFTHSTAPYADVVDWWAEISRGTGVDVVIGQSPYSAHAGSWNVAEISDQLRYNQKHPEIKGTVLYSFDYLDYSHMQHVEQDYWTVTPLNTWDSSSVSGPDITIDGTLFGNVYTEDVTVTLTSTDTIYYSFDNHNWIEYTAPFEVTGTGAHVVYMKTVDTNGVESLVTSKNIPIQYINNDVPVIDVTGDMIGDNYVLGATLNVTSNTEDIYVAINHGNVGEFNLFTGTITLDDTGSYYIRAKTIDSRGTESEEVTLSVTVQEECYSEPTISLSGNGEDPYYQNVNVTLSGETDLEYKINDGNWTAYTETLAFNTEGEYTISYRNDDACGIVYSRSFTVDTTAPAQAELTITGDYDGEKYYTSEVTLSLSTTEQDVSIMYRLHNGTSWTTWTEYSEPLDLLFTSNYTIEYGVVDQAGNGSGITDQRIRLKIPPSETNQYVVRDGKLVTYYDTNTPIELPTEYIEKTAEIRAVWIATVANIDITQHTSEEQYKNEIINMLNVIQANNFNTVFFQVRPMNDAFYDSSYAPWSRYLTGIEGQDPGWDVLGFIIEECHKRGIEFHAWLNPYRVSSGTDAKETQLSLLHDDNFAKENPDLVIADNSGKLILNPGERQVQVYIRNVINELIVKYDVDGIHFDDYFYSYNGTPDSADADLYNAKKEPGQTLADWRRENINTVVREIYEMIEAHNLENGKTVMFGISPFGIWSSTEEGGSNTSPYTLKSYSEQYADTKRWVEEGWVHYILPQLYWEFDHSSAPFADLADWWAELCEENGVGLIIGHGFYRYVGDSWGDVNELPEQLRYISQFDSVIGSSFFSYKTLLSSDSEVGQVIDRLNNYYWTEYATFPWPSTVEPQEPLVCEDGFHEENGECVEDEPIVCDPGFHWENNQCVEDDPLVCEDGFHEENGQCVEDEPLVCEDGYSEQNGECVKDPLVCTDLEVEKDGECVTRTCEEGYENIPGGCRKIPDLEPEPTDSGCGATILSKNRAYVLAGFSVLFGVVLLIKRRLFF